MIVTAAGGVGPVLQDIGQILYNVRFPLFEFIQRSFGLFDFCRFLSFDGFVSGSSVLSIQSQLFLVVVV